MVEIFSFLFSFTWSGCYICTKILSGDPLLLLICLMQNNAKNIHRKSYNRWVCFRHKLQLFEIKPLLIIAYLLAQKLDVIFSLIFRLRFWETQKIL